MWILFGVATKKAKKSWIKYTLLLCFALVHLTGLTEDGRKPLCGVSMGYSSISPIFFLLFFSHVCTKGASHHWQSLPCSRTGFFLPVAALSHFYHYKFFFFFLLRGKIDLSKAEITWCDSLRREIDGVAHSWEDKHREHTGLIPTAKLLQLMLTFETFLIRH